MSIADVRAAAERIAGRVVKTPVIRHRALDEAASKQREARAQAGFEAFAQSSGGKANQGKFYFYNITSLGYGKTAFANLWGNRELEDNWGPVRPRGRWRRRGGCRGRGATPG